MESVPLLSFPKDFLRMTMLKIHNKTEESLLQDADIIKTWLKTQPHLPSVLDHRSLLNFLILQKNSIEKTKLAIDMYYSLRPKIPELFANLDPKSEILILTRKINYWVMLPNLCDGLYRTAFYKVRDASLIDKLTPYNAVALFLCMQEVRLREDYIFGDVIVFDMAQLPLSYLSKLTPNVLATCTMIYEKVFSTPLKAVYLLNSPSYVATILAIVKRLLKPKIFQRIHVCPDESILHEKFPKEHVPKDYGGLEKSLEELQDMWEVKLEEHSNTFIELRNAKVNEDLRPAALKNDDLGVYGNFKKLSVD